MTVWGSLWTRRSFPYGLRSSCNIHTMYEWFEHKSQEQVLISFRLERYLNESSLGSAKVPSRHAWVFFMNRKTNRCQYNCLGSSLCSIRDEETDRCHTLILLLRASTTLKSGWRDKHMPIKLPRALTMLKNGWRDGQIPTLYNCLEPSLCSCLCSGMDEVSWFPCGYTSI